MLYSVFSVFIYSVLGFYISSMSWAQLAAAQPAEGGPVRPTQVVGGGTMSGGPAQETRLGLQLVEPSCKATNDQFAYFVRGVEAILLQWTALHLVTLHHDSDAMQFIHDEILEGRGGARRRDGGLLRGLLLQVQRHLGG